MSTNKPVIAVSGATGAQGGSVVNALLATGKYHVRGLTRNPSSDRSQALAAKSVEVVKANLSVRQDVENALRGADIAWIVTNFWDKDNEDIGVEERQGKLIADVAKAVGLNWLIYSSLSDTDKESNGRYPGVVHFIGKNKVEQYIRTLGIPNVTFVYAGFYASNISMFPLVPKDDGYTELALPLLREDTRLPIYDAETDTGPIVAKIIEEGSDKWNGKAIPAAAEYITPKQMVDTLSKVTGKPHRFRSLTEEETAKEMPFFNSQEWLQMLGWFRDYGYYGKDTEISDISVTKRLHPNMTTFEQYAAKKFGPK